MPSVDILAAIDSRCKSGISCLTPMPQLIPRRHNYNVYPKNCDKKPKKTIIYFHFPIQAEWPNLQDV